MEWDNGATIGYSAAGDFDNHDPSTRAVACVNSPDSDWSNVIYLISDANPEAEPPGEQCNIYNREYNYCSTFVIIFPENIVASNITYESANISWTVPYISQQQEYTVYYGIDEDSLDMMSNSVSSSSDLSLLDQNYSTVLSGLSLGTTYYFQVVATFQSFQLESDVSSFTTLELGKEY